jgi:hypothetical protein
VLLSNWILLEFDRNATPEIKARYGITALAMYTALLVIAWRHEGPVGLVFRLALLAALIGSGWDTYVYTWQRATASVDRSAENSRRVKRHARNLSIKEAIMRREAEHSVSVDATRADLEAQRALIAAERVARLESNTLYGDRLLANVRLEDKAERIKLIEADERLSLGAGNGNGGGKKNQLRSQPPALTSPDGDGVLATPSSPSSHSSFEDRRLILGILDAIADDPSANQRTIAQRLGVPRPRIGFLMGRLLEDGVIFKKGRSHYLSEDAEHNLAALRHDGR